MTKAEKLALMQEHRPPFLDIVGGRLEDFDAENGTGEMSFEVGTELCHSIDVVQGGFVTVMLDTSMAHTAMAVFEDVHNVLTYEVKVSFLEASRAGKFRCRAKIRKAGRSTAFTEAELYDADGVLTATASSTAKLVRPR